MSDQTPDIFISYSSKDRDWVAEFAKVLTACGYKVWWDRELLPGDNYHKKIDNALNKARCVVTVWSEHSVESKWVLAESGRADKRGVLIPVIYRSVIIPLAFDTSHNADLQHWEGDLDDMGFQQLLRSVARVTQKNPVSTGEVFTAGFMPKPPKTIPSHPSRNNLMLAGLVVCLVVVAVFWFSSAKIKPQEIKHRGILVGEQESGRVLMGGDSSIHTEGDLKFEASGDGNVVVTTGDGQVN